MQRQVVVPCVFCLGALAFQMNAATIHPAFRVNRRQSGRNRGYRADLSAVALTSILSIAIADSSSGLGGAAGQFSGFDLDAVKLSTTLCTTASCAAGLAGIPVFNFPAAGTVFASGTQRTPADPKLFGTDAAGSNVDNAVATLGLFDGNSTTASPGAWFRQPGRWRHAGIQSHKRDFAQQPLSVYRRGRR